MANPEHVEILKQGVDAWNEWRSEHERVRPDLSGIDLSEVSLKHESHMGLLEVYEVIFSHKHHGGINLSDVDLKGTKLIGADLNRANLNRADLSGAYLSHANLVRAILRRADLSSAHLFGADLSSAHLFGADFRDADLGRAILSDAYLEGANLVRANLNYADLKGANLEGADLGHANFSYANFTEVRLAVTTFVNNDLSEVKGLERVIHLAPSSIGIDTVYKSRGKIPEIFLRGCGVPESFIKQVPALVAALEPIQFYSCFISYSSKDHPFADRLHADLQSKGVRCWFASEDLKIGDRFRDRIDESIRVHDKLLLILSEHSVASPWVSDEVEAALEREHREGRTVLFPIKIDEAVIESTQAWAASIRRTRHIGDFRKWKEHDSYSKAFDRLLRDLKAEASKP